MRGKLPKATLRAFDLPALGPGVRRLEVECPRSCTGVTMVPGPVALTDELVALVAGFAHEERCGQCDVGHVLAQGDQRARELTEALWPQIQGARISQQRRN